MAAIINRVAASAGRMLWLDYSGYAARLLAGGTAPWLDVASAAAWLRRAQGLLGSDVLSVPVGEVAEAWVAAQPGLREAMGARSRAVFPLRTLLADDALRAHLVALVQALRGSLPGPGLVLRLPSPRAWVRAAYEQAHGSGIEVGDDEADSAAVYVADFLRSFGESGVDGLLLAETDASEPADASGVACYQPVINIARHYRWDVGLAVPGARYAGGEAGLDFVVGPSPLPGAVQGLAIGPDFWDAAAPPAAVEGRFRYAAVPTDANPERVLERLASLR